MFLHLDQLWPVKQCCRQCSAMENQIRLRVMSAAARTRWHEVGPKGCSESRVSGVRIYWWRLLRLFHPERSTQADNLQQENNCNVKTKVSWLPFTVSIMTRIPIKQLLLLVFSGYSLTDLIVHVEPFASTWLLVPLRYTSNKVYWSSCKPSIYISWQRLL